MDEELNILIFNVLHRYKEVYGKKCFDEIPKTDLQEAMQVLEKYFSHNQQINADRAECPACKTYHDQNMYCRSCGKT